MLSQFRNLRRLLAAAMLLAGAEATAATFGISLGPSLDDPSLKRLAELSAEARRCRQRHAGFAALLATNVTRSAKAMSVSRLRYLTFSALAMGRPGFSWPDGAFSQTEAVKTVNREVKALTADCARFAPVGVRFTGFPVDEAAQLGEAAGELAVEATPIRGLGCEEGGRLVIGEFAATDDSREYAALVVAADDPEGTGTGVRKLVFFAPAGIRVWGREGRVAANLGADGRYRLELPSDGALFIVTRREIDTVLGDDQLRCLWYLHDGIYPQFLAAGFNSIIDNPFVDGFWAETNEFDVARWQARLKRYTDDGVGYILQCPWGHDKADARRFPRIRRDGTEPPRHPVNAANPDFLKLTDERVRSLATRTAKAPAALIGMQTATEIRDTSEPSLSPADSNRYFQATGRKIPEGAAGRAAPHWSKLPNFPKNRIIDVNDPLYAYYRWLWKAGDGWNGYHSRVHDGFSSVYGVRRYFSLYDPGQRTPPMWGSGGNVGALNEWTYLCDHPAKIAFVTAEQQAMARGSGKAVISMIQAFGYRTALTDMKLKLADEPQWSRDWPNTKWPTMPPDIVREGLWQLFSRQIDGIAFHGWNALFDGRPFGQQMSQHSYAYTHPGTKDVVSNLFHTVAIPLGPCFKAAPERPSEVALLESEASALFGGEPPWDWRGKPYAAGVVATEANLSPYVIYEDEITERGIPAHVKVLLLPACEVLTRSACEVIREFQRRGGKLVADASLTPALKADAPLSEHPAELKATVARFVKPHASANRTDLLLHVREAGAAELVFVTNDRREFGDYVGPWKVVRERGLANSGELAVNFGAGAVYDLVTHRSLPFSVTNGITRVQVEFATSDGKALLFAKRPLWSLAVTREDSELVIRTMDDDILVPIGIFAEGAKPRYAVIRGGVWRGKVSGEKVKVLNLATGAWARLNEGADFEKQRREFAGFRFGIFVHWGVYANYGQGEWYMLRVGMPDDVYCRMRDGFYPSKFDAREWVRIIKNAGAKYLTITSRHHDGFSLWPTKVDDGNNIANTPFKRDILGELAEACREAGIQLNFYYSLMDWHRRDYPTGGNYNPRWPQRPPMYKDYRSYKRFMMGQLTELLDNYHPGNIWFDGEWDHCRVDEKLKERRPYDLDWELDDLYDLIHSKGAMVANNNHLRIRPKEDIQLFERDLPGENGSGFSAGMKVTKSRPIEQCDVLQRGVWGYKAAQQDFRTAPEVVAMVARAAAKGSNLLMNIGPDGSGQFPARAVKVMAEVGKWFAKHGDTIYGTEAGGVGQGKDVVSTRKGDKLYLHFLNPAVRSFDYAGKTYTVDRSDGNEFDIVVEVERESENYELCQ